MVYQEKNKQTPKPAHNGAKKCGKVRKSAKKTLQHRLKTLNHPDKDPQN